MVARKTKEISNGFRIYGPLVNERDLRHLNKAGQIEVEKRKRLKDSFTSKEEEDVL